MADPIQTLAATAAPAASNGANDADRAKVQELAHQFEAMLMTQMLRSMRQSMLSDGESESDGLGKATMTDTFDGELGQTLSGAGGIGLSAMLVRAFDRQAAGRAPAPTPTTTSTATPTSTAMPTPTATPTPTPTLSTPPQTSPTLPPPMSPASAQMPASASPPAVFAPLTTMAPAAAAAGDPSGIGSAPVLPEGRVTSGYGWRSDPFNGRMKFHSGTDVQMAYGQDVNAAAAGRVTFVGEQSGYGLTVVVDHGNGLQSRYAHLSSATVQPGDTVESGQVIARSGNSGRSTGPHLHFEVLDKGKAVDPGTMGQLLH